MTSLSSLLPSHPPLPTASRSVQSLGTLSICWSTSLLSHIRCLHPVAWPPPPCPHRPPRSLRTSVTSVVAHHALRKRPRKRRSTAARRRRRWRPVFENQWPSPAAIHSSRTRRPQPSATPTAPSGPCRHPFLGVARNEIRRNRRSRPQCFPEMGGAKGARHSRQRSENRGQHKTPKSQDSKGSFTSLRMMDLSFHHYGDPAAIAACDLFNTDTRPDAEVDGACIPCKSQSSSIARHLAQGLPQASDHLASSQHESDNGTSRHDRATIRVLIRNQHRILLCYEFISSDQLTKHSHERTRTSSSSRFLPMTFDFTQNWMDTLGQQQSSTFLHLPSKAPVMVLNPRDPKTPRIQEMDLFRSVAEMPRNSRQSCNRFCPVDTALIPRF
jgi:hypothetical protein